MSGMKLSVLVIFLVLFTSGLYGYNYKRTQPSYRRTSAYRSRLGQSGTSTYRSRLGQSGTSTYRSRFMGHSGGSTYRSRFMGHSGGSPSRSYGISRDGPDACKSQPCMHGSKCYNSKYRPSGYSCICTGGSYGDRCENGKKILL